MGLIEGVADRGSKERHFESKVDRSVTIRSQTPPFPTRVSVVPSLGPLNPPGPSGHTPPETAKEEGGDTTGSKDKNYC